MIDNHINQTLMEQYFLDRENLPAQDIRNMQEHLEHCALCREQYAHLEQFYGDLNKRMQETPTEQDREFAGRLITGRFFDRASRLLPFKSSRQTAMAPFDKMKSLKKIPLIYPIIRFAVFHPLKFAAANVTAAAATIGTFLMLQQAPEISDRNPEYARAKDEFLVAYNKSGEELWRQHIGLNFDEEIMKSSLGHDIGDKIIKTFDLNNDGKKEILAIVGFSVFSKRNSVTCYKSDGTINWIFSFSRRMTFGNYEYFDDYGTSELMVQDINGDSLAEIFVVYNHALYYPSALLRLDALTGNLMEEYWNPGAIYSLAHYDLDGDGRDEIIFGGTHNGYNTAFMGVLKPGQMSGHAPAPPAYTPAGYELNPSQKYLLFPRSDLAEFSTAPRSNVPGIRFIQDGTVFIDVNEVYRKTGSLIMYFSFNQALQCIKVDVSDQFRMFHEQMRAEGKVTQTIDARYFEALRRGVQYWDGEGFTNQISKSQISAEFN